MPSERPPADHAEPDRDLIEDARMALHLASLGIVDLEKWARSKVPAVLDELEAARSRIAELEAAQRPPLGYVAAETSGSLDLGPLTLDRVEAEQHVADLSEAYPVGVWRLAELREMQS